MTTKTEKYLTAGAIGVAGATAAALCPPIALHIKVATMTAIGNVLKS